MKQKLGSTETEANGRRRSSSQSDLAMVCLSDGAKRATMKKAFCRHALSAEAKPTPVDGIWKCCNHQQLFGSSAQSRKDIPISPCPEAYAKRVCQTIEISPTEVDLIPRIIHARAQQDVPDLAPLWDASRAVGLPK